MKKTAEKPEKKKVPVYNRRTGRDDHSTPPEFFKKIDCWLARNFGSGFVLDVCASKKNAKCENFLTEEDDALSDDLDWRACITADQAKQEKCFFWCNPPYKTKTQDAFLRTAFLNARGENGQFVVCALIPARTDAKRWQQMIAPFADHIFFLPGRIKFEGEKNTAPFPSALVFFGELPGVERIIFGMPQNSHVAKNDRVNSKETKK